MSDVSKTNEALIAEARKRWLPVVGYESYYEVSDQGRIRSLDREIEWNETTRVLCGAVLSGTRSTIGHRQVRLSMRGKAKTLKVHRLVLEAFVGPCPMGMEGCHGNDIPDDNRLENLRWDTRSGNALDRVRNGKHHWARRTHCHNGHELSGDNIRLGGHGERICIQCKRLRNRQDRERRSVA